MFAWESLFNAILFFNILELLAQMIQAYQYSDQYDNRVGNHLIVCVVCLWCRCMCERIVCVCNLSRTWERFLRGGVNYETVLHWKTSQAR